MKQEFRALAFGSQFPMGKVLKPFAYNYLCKLYCERHFGGRSLWLLLSFNLTGIDVDRKWCALLCVERLRPRKTRAETMMPVGMSVTNCHDQFALVRIVFQNICF